MGHLHGLKYVTVWDQLAGNWAFSDDHFGKGIGALNSSLLSFSFHSHICKTNSTWEHSFSRWFCRVPRNGEPLVFREGPQREAVGVGMSIRHHGQLGKPGICSLSLCQFLVLWHWAIVLNFSGASFPGFYKWGIHVSKHFWFFLALMFEDSKWSYLVSGSYCSF